MYAVFFVLIMLSKEARNLIWNSVESIKDIKNTWSVTEIAKFIHEGEDNEISQASFEAIRKMVERRALIHSIPKRCAK